MSYLNTGSLRSFVHIQNLDSPEFIAKMNAWGYDPFDRMYKTNQGKLNNWLLDDNLNRLYQIAESGRFKGTIDPNGRYIMSYTEDAHSNEGEWFLKKHKIIIDPEGDRVTIQCRYREPRGERTPINRVYYCKTKSDFALSEIKERIEQEKNKLTKMNKIKFFIQECKEKFGDKLHRIIEGPWENPPIRYVYRNALEELNRFRNTDKHIQGIMANIIKHCARK